MHIHGVIVHPPFYDPQDEIQLMNSLRKIWLSGTNRFALATGGSVAMLFAGLYTAPIVSWLALFYMTGLVYGLDRLTALAAPDLPEQEFPAGTRLMIALGAVHFPLLFLGASVIVTSPFIKAFPLFFALALFFGQVSNSNAHELIHRTVRWQHRLGIAVYSSLLFGHHASAHPFVHHIHVATPQDPNSARLGESYYAFALRAWRGSFRAGFRAEKRRKNLLRSFGIYGLGSISTCLIAFIIGGVLTAVIVIALGLYAQIQLLLSDYVQHYGLRRTKLDTGRYEPVSACHSWNAPHGFSSSLMMNAPRHSDHHSRPLRHYPGLALDQSVMPMLPRSLPVMASIALFPPVWKKLMDPRVVYWVNKTKSDR